MSGLLFVLCFGGVSGVILLFQSRSHRRQAAERSAEQAQREKDDAAFWKAAKRVSAKVLSSYQFGQLNLEPVLHLRLRIEAPDGAYEVEVEKAVDVIKAHRFEKGSTVELWVDPAHRERIELAS